MRALSWNCRGLEGPFTISQLKESFRDHLPNFVFLCETKNKDHFVRIVCRKLKFQSRWTSTEPVGLSGGLLLCWSEETVIHQIIRSNFGFEVEFETSNSGGKCWGIFLYLSPNFSTRMEPWVYLQNNKAKWGKRWFLGGDLNDIRRPDEKRGGRLRFAGSYELFRK